MKRSEAVDILKSVRRIGEQVPQVYIPNVGPVPINLDTEDPEVAVKFYYNFFFKDIAQKFGRKVKASEILKLIQDYASLEYKTLSDRYATNIIYKTASKLEKEPPFIKALHSLGYGLQYAIFEAVPEAFSTLTLGLSDRISYILKQRGVDEFSSAYNTYIGLKAKHNISMNFFDKFMSDYIAHTGVGGAVRGLMDLVGFIYGYQFFTGLFTKLAKVKVAGETAKLTMSGLESGKFTLSGLGRLADSYIKAMEGVLPWWKQMFWDATLFTVLDQINAVINPYRYSFFDLPLDLISGKGIPKEGVYELSVNALSNLLFSAIPSVFRVSEAFTGRLLSSVPLSFLRKAGYSHIRELLTLEKPNFAPFLTRQIAESLVSFPFLAGITTINEYLAYKTATLFGLISGIGGHFDLTSGLLSAGLLTLTRAGLSTMSYKKMLLMVDDIIKKTTPTEEVEVEVPALAEEPPPVLKEEEKILTKEESVLSEERAKWQEFENQIKEFVQENAIQFRIKTLVDYITGITRFPLGSKYSSMLGSVGLENSVKTYGLAEILFSLAGRYNAFAIAVEKDKSLIPYLEVAEMQMLKIAKDIGDKTGVNIDITFTKPDKDGVKLVKDIGIGFQRFEFKDFASDLQEKLKDENYLWGIVADLKENAKYGDLLDFFADFMRDKIPFPEGGAFATPEEGRASVDIWDLYFKFKLTQFGESVKNFFANPVDFYLKEVGGKSKSKAIRPHSIIASLFKTIDTANVVKAFDLLNEVTGSAGYFYYVDYDIAFAKYDGQPFYFIYPVLKDRLSKKVQFNPLEELRGKYIITSEDLDKLKIDWRREFPIYHKFGPEERKSMKSTIEKFESLVSSLIDIKDNIQASSEIGKVMEEIKPEPNVFLKDYPVVKEEAKPGEEIDILDLFPPEVESPTSPKPKDTDLVVEPMEMKPSEGEFEKIKGELMNKFWKISNFRDLGITMPQGVKSKPIPIISKNADVWFKKVRGIIRDIISRTRGKDYFDNLLNEINLQLKQLDELALKYKDRLEADLEMHLAVKNKKIKGIDKLREYINVIGQTIKNEMTFKKVGEEVLPVSETTVGLIKEIDEVNIDVNLRKLLNRIDDYIKLDSEVKALENQIIKNPQNKELQNKRNSRSSLRSQVKRDILDMLNDLLPKFRIYGQQDAVQVLNEKINSILEEKKIKSPKKKEEYKRNVSALFLSFVNEFFEGIKRTMPPLPEGHWFGQMLDRAYVKKEGISVRDVLKEKLREKFLEEQGEIPTELDQIIEDKMKLLNTQAFLLELFEKTSRNRDRIVDYFVPYFEEDLFHLEERTLYGRKPEVKKVVTFEIRKDIPHTEISKMRRWGLLGEKKLMQLIEPYLAKEGEPSKTISIDVYKKFKLQHSIWTWAISRPNEQGIGRAELKPFNIVSADVYDIILRSLKLDDVLDLLYKKVKDEYYATSFIESALPDTDELLKGTAFKEYALEGESSIAILKSGAVDDIKKVVNKVKKKELDLETRGLLVKEIVKENLGAFINNPVEGKRSFEKMKYYNTLLKSVFEDIQKGNFDYDKLPDEVKNIFEEYVDFLVQLYTYGDEKRMNELKDLFMSNLIAGSLNNELTRFILNQIYELHNSLKGTLYKFRSKKGKEVPAEELVNEFLGQLKGGEIMKYLEGYEIEKAIDELGGFDLLNWFGAGLLISTLGFEILKEFYNEEVL